MPQEKQCPGERPVRSDSKNAKEKSNSAALRAEHGAGGLGHVRGRNSRCESEKDSGYSDGGSDCLQTDSEDQRSSVSQRCGPPVSRGVGGGAPQSTATFGEFTPIYIVKNLVLKQPLTLQASTDQTLNTQLPWGGGPHKASATNGQPATQLLFIQQPTTAAPSPAPTLLKPLPKKVCKDTYLPILNSYPRIAPHPSKSLDPAKSSNAGKPGGTSLTEGSLGHRQSKRVCMEERREAVSSSELPRKEPPKQPGHQSPSAPPNKAPRVHQPAQPPPSALPASPAESSSLGSPSVSSSETPVTKVSKKHVSNVVKQRRFLNTVEILSHSGLLGITLKTKDLIRQNHSTKREIAELREHTRLLCQAVHSNDPQAWAQLQEAMAASGHYPDLNKGLGPVSLDIQVKDPAPPQTAPGLALECTSTPPTPSFSSSPACVIDLSRRRRKNMSPLNVPPDSSTHACLP
ncbi:CLOCK-interacting pacemaker [Amia ocellicauda]|uniref:CLOCK-interacting pacemaker n=1 Tax=Amia ocellicauda TaxID=2972642 RepID=UPI003464BAF2